MGKLGQHAIKVRPHLVCVYVCVYIAKTFWVNQNGQASYHSSQTSYLFPMFVLFKLLKIQIGITTDSYLTKWTCVWPILKIVLICLQIVLTVPSKNPKQFFKRTILTVLFYYIPVALQGYAIID